MGTGWSLAPFLGGSGKKQFWKMVGLLFLQLERHKKRREEKKKKRGEEGERRGREYREGDEKDIATQKEVLGTQQALLIWMDHR